MLKLWILVLHQASEQLWTEEEQKTVMGQLSTFDEAELAHVSNLTIIYSDCCLHTYSLLKANNS